MERVLRGLSLAAAAGAFLLAIASPASASSRRLDVVVELELPSLSEAVETSRALRADVKRQRLDVAARTSAAYLDSLAVSQAATVARIQRAVPEASVHRRYRVVLNGLAVTVPASAVGRLARVPGIERVYPSARYSASVGASVLAIKAPALWGAELVSAGNGVKIGIIDTGIDQTHPYFDPRGYQPPPGYPRGQLAYTNGKVIVARSFAPARTRWRYARRPFDPTGSDHGTHVAGIAAGNHATRASNGESLAGVAPRAYIGNYKALSVPAPGGSLNGNSPELVAAIEAAVADGMDVINLSVGEPEVEPTRDVVARAIDAAADAGVVPAVAAGNDYDDLGRGSLMSPGAAAKAITAGAVEFRDGRPLVTSFSAAGPTPLSLRLKPDVAAPGLDVVSAVPGRRFAAFSGTSMAAPHVAGAAALLRQRHPTWTVEQIKSALVTTGVAVRSDDAPSVDAPVIRAGGGLIDVTRADAPLVFVSPTSVSLGLVRPGASVTRAIALSDAGGGAGPWTASVERDGAIAGVAVEVPPAVTVPGVVPLTVRVAGSAVQQEEGGFVVLTRGSTRRRVPYWFRVSRPRLSAARAFPLRRTATYGGNTAGRPALVTTYRYPDNAASLGVTRVLRGPEQVFRLRLRRPAANFGAAVLTRARGVRVEPRVVRAGDENRLMGPVGLPIVLNAYLPRYSHESLVAGAILPAAGRYDIVFDSRTRTGAGRFTFRFWVNDVRPPRLRLLTRSVQRYGFLRVAARDAGSGVDPASVVARIDGRPAPAAYDRRSGRVLVLVSGVPAGRHRLVVQVSDYQETKNVENVARILPNTATLRAAFRVR